MPNGNALGVCHRTNIWHKKEPKFHFEYGVYNGVIAITPYRASPLFPTSLLGMFIGICGALKTAPYEAFHN